MNLTQKRVLQFVVDTLTTYKNADQTKISYVDLSTLCDVLGEIVGEDYNTEANDVVGAIATIISSVQNIEEQ